MKRLEYSTTTDSRTLASYKGYSIEKAWEVDYKGNRIPGSVMYMVIDDEDDWIGDVYSTLSEAHAFIDELTSSRPVTSATLPEGYLGTTKFTCPSIRTDDQRNALEAFEIAVSEKFNQFDAMCDITMHLTSEAAWQGVIEEYDTGYYINVSGTRSSFQAFVSGDHVIRKPRNARDMHGYYYVEGVNGTVYYMSKFREMS